MFRNERVPAKQTDLIEAIFFCVNGQSSPAQNQFAPPASREITRPRVGARSFARILDLHGLRRVMIKTDQSE